MSDAADMVTALPFDGAELILSAGSVCSSDAPDVPSVALSAAFSFVVCTTANL
ncbi:MAG: hypothetical protein ICV63_10570 [Coleofasciculus sp. Co-bin14]|nr:hypothetical protein [Coleofasciculus sp. Co-bin14]